jgi:hypothetical protein
MAKKTIAALKEYFKVGKRPTESQFDDLIDSYVHLDESSEYKTTVEFPANYQVGDYVEFLQVEPSSAGAGGFFEVSIVYTRNNTASAATHIAAVSHSNPDVWKECGTINKNNYVDGPENNNLTVDINGGTCRFRIRAVHTYGAADQVLKAYVKIRSINKNDNWTALNNRGNTADSIPLQPMSNEWNLWVGDLRSSESAKIGLKVSTNGNVGIGTLDPKYKFHVAGRAYSTEQTIQSWSPTLYMYRDREQGGFTQGVQTRLVDGTDNWYFGNLGTQEWRVSKGNWENPKLLITENGNVGINTVDPISPLSVGMNHGAKLSVGNSTWKNTEIIATNYDDTNGDYTDVKVSGYGVNSSLLRINSKGNVGIGNANPQSKLDVAGGINIASGFPIQLSGIDLAHGLKYKRFNSDNSLLDGPFLYGWTGGALGIKKGDVEFNVLSWKESGNVAIYGKLEAKDVLVTQTPTADHVFAADYNLRGIKDLGNYINENKHLPEIPSAKEMTDHGLSVADFQIKLLQKIEEMSLYIISLDKEIDILKSK